MLPPSTIEHGRAARRDYELRAEDGRSPRLDYDASAAHRRQIEEARRRAELDPAPPPETGGG
jgi:hypothetical protein